MYEITDRDWDKSPASEIEGYNATTNTITGYTYGSSYSDPGTNPYLHVLYVNRSVTNEMRAWKKDSDSSENNHGKSAEWYIDREHIWPKSHGFEDSELDKGTSGARGDPMQKCGEGFDNVVFHCLWVLIDVFMFFYKYNTPQTPKI